MDNTWKDEISHTILNIFGPYNGIDVLKLPFPEELLWMRGFHAYDTASVS